LEGDSESPEMPRIVAQQPAVALIICLGAWNLGGGRRWHCEGRPVEVRDGGVRGADLAPMCLD
jgi:hypothetical protein